MSLKKVADWYRRLGENYHNTPLHIRQGPLILPDVAGICAEAFVITRHWSRPRFFFHLIVVDRELKAANAALNVKRTIESEGRLECVFDVMREIVMRLDFLQWAIERMRDPLNNRLAEERFFLKEEEKERVKLKGLWLRSLPLICYDQWYKDRRAEQTSREAEK